MHVADPPGRGRRPPARRREPGEAGRVTGDGRRGCGAEIDEQQRDGAVGEPAGPNIVGRGRLGAEAQPVETGLQRDNLAPGAAGVGGGAPALRGRAGSAARLQEEGARHSRRGEEGTRPRVGAEVAAVAATAAARAELNR